MSDTLSKTERSKLMARVRSSGNRSTELRMRRILRDMGVSGWRTRRPVVGRPDFVFPQRRIALFVDGCFWHGHPSLGRVPKSNRRFWLRKISANRKRDAFVNRALRARGWTVIRIWENELGGPSVARKLKPLVEVASRERR